jgi:hypothetical protein
MKNASRIKEQSSTAGLASYELASSGALYRRFRDELATGERVRFFAASNGDYEEVIGVLTYGTPDTISRDTILRSSQSGAKINWPAGTRDLFVDPLPGTVPVQTKGGSYTATFADHGSLLLFAGTTTPTLTLPAAATVCDGFSFEVKNDGTGDLTIDGNAAETINGALTAIIKPGSSGFVRCTGTAWFAVGFASLDIAGLAEDAAPDGTADFLPTFDASASGNKKIQVRRAGAIAQSIHLTTSTYQTFATGTLIPRDNTPPLNTEGNQVFTQAVTLMRAAGRMRLSGTIHVACSTARTHQIAVFRGSTCIYASGEFSGGSEEVSLEFVVEDAPGSVGPHTYSVRVGVDLAVTQWVNGNSSGALFGGVNVSHFTLMEFAP